MVRKLVYFIALFLILQGGSAVGAVEFDFADLFGDDLLVEVDEAAGAVRPEEALLIQERWELGGHYNFGLHVSRTYMKGADPEDAFRVSLGSDLYLDARPEAGFRVFTKVNLNADVGKNSDAALQLKLGELFSDFNYDNKVFFRAGKQQTKWGVGYFFSPADLLSTGRIDPQNPDRELGGPIALKIHCPRQSSNYYTYLLFDRASALTDAAIAPKMEFVRGRSELGLGAFYQKDRVPRLMGTVSSSLGSVALFGEAVVSKGSDKGFAGELGLADYPLREKKRLFLHATAGARYTRNDPAGLFSFTGAVQYYFNGEGYREQAKIRDFRRDYSFVLALNPEAVSHVARSDLSSTGRHYLAVMVNWSQVLNSKASLGAVWTANLSDRSGIIGSTLSLPSLGRISPSIGVTFNYGDPFTEFGLLGKGVTTVFAAVTLGSNFK